MSVPPVPNPWDPQRSVPQMRQSKLLQAALYQQRGYQGDVRQWNVRTALDVLREVLPTSNLTTDALNSVSVAYLPAEKRGIIYYLRRNPAIFQQVQNLSSQYPTEATPAWLERIRLQDLETQAAEQRAQTNAATQRSMPTPDLIRAFGSRPEKEMQQLLRTVQQQLPPQAPGANTAGTQNPLPVATLNWLAQNPQAIAAMQLDRTQRQQLDALLQQTTLNLIQGLARSQQMLMNPDVIRILVSLLWNPQLHRPGGYLPLSAFEPRTPSEDAEFESEKPIEELEATTEDMMSEMHEPHDPTDSAFQRIELSAHEIRDLCRHLKKQGGITLEELQNYQPVNEKEAELLRYLRQFSIFHTLSDLNGEDETLDPADIRIALHDETFVLTDEHITLVITP